MSAPRRVAVAQPAKPVTAELPAQEAATEARPPRGRRIAHAAATVAAVAAVLVLGAAALLHLRTAGTIAGAVIAAAMAGSVLAPGLSADPEGTRP